MGLLSFYSFWLLEAHSVTYFSGKSHGNISLIAVYLCPLYLSQFCSKTGISNFNVSHFSKPWSLLSVFSLAIANLTSNIIEEREAPFLNIKHINLLSSFLLLKLRACPSLVAQAVKNLPIMQETWVWSLGWEDPLEEGMAVFLHGESPWTEKPGGLQSIGSQRVGHDWVIKHSTALLI